MNPTPSLHPPRVFVDDNGSALKVFVHALEITVLASLRKYGAHLCDDPSEAHIIVIDRDSMAGRNAARLWKAEGKIVVSTDFVGSSVQTGVCNFTPFSMDLSGPVSEDEDNYDDVEAFYGPRAKSPVKRGHQRTEKSTSKSDVASRSVNKRPKTVGSCSQNTKEQRFSSSSPLTDLSASSSTPPRTQKREPFIWEDMNKHFPRDREWSTKKGHANIIVGHQNPTGEGPIDIDVDPDSSFEGVQGQNRATNTPPIDPGKLFKGADGKALSIWLQVLMPNPQRTRIKKLILNNGGKLARNKVDIDYCVICPRNTSHAKDVETMRAYKKPIVLPQWIEECCQQNKLLDWTAFDISPLVRDQKIPVKTEVMPIDLSSPPPAPRPKHGTSKGRAARTSFKAPSEPGPPTPHQTMHSSGAAVFTAEDVTYLRKFLRWILFHNERTTIATISRELGIRTSHHSAASWERYMHRHNHLLLETKAWVERRKTGQPEPSNRHPILVVD